MFRPKLGGLKPRLAYLDQDKAQRSRARDASVPWRRWYKTAAWQRLAWAVKVRDAFTCQRCGLTSDAKYALAVDHIKPHRGDEALFWDERNLQTLCKGCHDGAKQREEAADRG